MVDWIGKTLVCHVCGIEVKIVKPNNPNWGSGPSLICCGEEMKVKSS
jgi:hypothetical protein